MASVPFFEGTLQLAQASEGNRARTLLKAATELFVFEERHTRTEIAVYEELARQLLPITSTADRQTIAALLARHPDAPLTIVRDLLADVPEVALELISAAPFLADADLLAVLATRTGPVVEAVARRPRLSPALIEALVNRLPTSSYVHLVQNASIRLAPEIVGRLIEAAKDRPALASALARRGDDVDDIDLVDLFLDLDAAGRRRVVQAIEILALRDFAARRPRPQLPVPDRAVAAELGRVALSRDLDRVAGLLVPLIGIDEPLVRRLLADEGGEPLAVALKASGLDAPLAMRVLLFSGPTEGRPYFPLKRLVELFETVSYRSAALLVARWRGDRTPLTRTAVRHVPQTEAGTPVRMREPRPAAAPAPATVRPAEPGRTRG